MTDNIQKLYKVAGFEEKRGIELTIDPTSEEPKFNEHYVCYGYPPFTAEKQLELIKWLATKQEKFTILYDSDYGYTCEVVNINNCYESFSYYELIQALCNLTIGLWDELSSEQREEVREILG